MTTAQWNFDNSYTSLPEFFYTKQCPLAVAAPKPVIYNEALAACLHLPLQVEVLAGNEIPPGAEPLAQAYAGHQFGYFTMLGDGRAILLGEHLSAAGERYDIQLKGSGPTPYSRGGDGRAALGPMLREYLISEAMDALGIPTTRSLAVVATGETVRREKNHAGAVLTRIAKSHIRVGTFEYAARFGTAADVRALADYTIARHFPAIADVKNSYLLFLGAVIKGQAALIAKWQSIGFIHGVMNTDNMAISGETIDYGPCAFMDVYDPATVFSSIDSQGRYAYENQPRMGVWNLARLAESLLPFLHEDRHKAVALAQEELAGFWLQYEKHWLAEIGAKLGLFNAREEDELLIADLLRLMKQHQADFTQTFKSLTLDQPEGQRLFADPLFLNWQKRWQRRLCQQPESYEESRALMKSHNPAIIPRNHLVEEALAAAENDDLGKIRKLLAALANPYGYLPAQEEFSQLPPAGFGNYRTFCGT